MTQFHVAFDKTQQFRAAIKKYHDALETSEYDYSWSSVAAGAPGPTFTLVTYHENFADFAPDDSFQMTSVMSEEELGELMKSFAECVKGSESNIVAVR